MASGLVHDIQSQVIYGRTYREVHKKKDAPSKWLPGKRHRCLRHGWYRKFGKRWTFADPFPNEIPRRRQRIGDTAGSTRGEEYMASVSHDYLDRIWDFDSLTREERKYTRNYWEAFHIWLVLNPRLLREWAGVDVFDGRIRRVIDGAEVWEDEPNVVVEYRSLYERARFILHRKKDLRYMVELYGELVKDIQR